MGVFLPVPYVAYYPLSKIKIDPYRSTVNELRPPTWCVCVASIHKSTWGYLKISNGNIAGLHSHLLHSGKTRENVLKCFHFYKISKKTRRASFWAIIATKQSVNKHLNYQKMYWCASFGRAHTCARSEHKWKPFKSWILIAFETRQCGGAVFVRAMVKANEFSWLFKYSLITWSQLFHENSKI